VAGVAGAGPDLSFAFASEEAPIGALRPRLGRGLAVLHWLSGTVLSVVARPPLRPGLAFCDVITAVSGRPARRDRKIRRSKTDGE